MRRSLCLAIWLAICLSIWLAACGGAEPARPAAAPEPAAAAESPCVDLCRAKSHDANGLSACITRECPATPPPSSR